ncbi:MAG TPA: carboxypeptidase regulatory-like domain-containing protein [Vicinamibacteria bacterium]|nr:carboxypeptidase regulatory-like domain-containing protein [Vicinamibacteria bacterium]
MSRHSLIFGSAMLAGALVTVEARGAAAVSISGTVKVTGSASAADVVVYIQQAPGTFTPPAKPVEMDQKQMQFVPHVLPVVAGTKVAFLNSDPTPHNVFTPDNEKYNLGTWPQGQTKDYTFAKCAKFPCAYTQLCRVHPEMEAYVVVLQNPYFAVTDKAGHYQIEGVPPGDYTVAVWHWKTKAQPTPVTVDAAKPATVDFVLTR